MSYDVLTPSAARLWSYGPDWSSGFNVKRAFATDIFVSRNNTEQRRALRTNPRLSVDYRTRVSDEDFRDANHWLRAWQNKPAIIPDFARWARLTGASAAGASTLTVNPLPAWAAEGQRLVLCAVSGIEEVLVASVAGTTITLAGALSAAWGVDSVLRPTFFGLMDGRVSTSRLTRGAAEISVALDAYPGGTPPRAAGTAWATHNGREVFTFEPDYASPPSIAGLWPAEQIDVGRGRTAQFRPIDRAENLTEAEFRGLSLATATEVEQFFDRMKGRRTAFYRSTGERDFELAATAAEGATTFLASGSDVASDFGSIDYAAVETSIAICMTDGSHIYRTVTDISASGGDSLITVSAPWGAELSSSSVSRISWMPVSRLAADEMTMSWQTPLTARTRLPFQTVRR